VCLVINLLMIYYLHVFSKKNLREEGSSSSVWSVIESSLPAHFRIFERFSMERPKVRGRSQRYSLNPFSFNFNETNATCAESMACIDKPLEFASMLTDFTRSLMESMIFLNEILCCSLASNILE